MREFVFAVAGIASLAVAAPALAQSDDSSFGGIYLGVTAGGSWGDTSTTTNAVPGGGAVVIPPADLAAIRSAGTGSKNKTGFVGGIEGGYNFVSGPWLLGIEGDFSAFNINQSKNSVFTSGLAVTPPVIVTFTQNLNTDWLWSIRPRVGYVGGPWMVYATGGVAGSKIKYGVNFSDTRSPPDLANQRLSDTKTGWIAGVGGAYSFAPNWSVKGEWLYTDLGKLRGSVATPTGYVGLISEAKVKANILRAGVDFRF